jgi:hypothetical protein
MKLNRAEAIKIKEIAEKYNLSIEEVEAIVSAPYTFIHYTTKKMVLKDNMTREEFDATKTNFNIPSIGKLYASYFMYNEIQKKKNKKS